MNCQYQILDTPTSDYLCMREYPYKICTYLSVGDIQYCPNSKREEDNHD